MLEKIKITRERRRKLREDKETEKQNEMENKATGSICPAAFFPRTKTLKVTKRTPGEYEYPSGNYSRGHCARTKAVETPCLIDFVNLWRFKDENKKVERAGCERRNNGSGQYFSVHNILLPYFPNRQLLLSGAIFCARGATFHSTESTTAS